MLKVCICIGTSILYSLTKWFTMFVAIILSEKPCYSISQYSRSNLCSNGWLWKCWTSSANYGATMCYSILHNMFFPKSPCPVSSKSCYQCDQFVQDNLCTRQRAPPQPTVVVVRLAPCDTGAGRQPEWLRWLAGRSSDDAPGTPAHLYRQRYILPALCPGL